MRRRCGIVVVLAAWLAAALPAFGQSAADALKLLPDDAVGFVLVKNLSEAAGQAEAVAKRFKAPVPPLLEKAKKELGIDKGLNEKGPLLIALLMPKGDGEPIGLGYVPVTSYDDF